MSPDDSNLARLYDIVNMYFEIFLLPRSRPSGGAITPPGGSNQSAVRRLPLFFPVGSLCTVAT